MKCPECGTSNLDAMSSCGTCGAKLNIVAPRRCVGCGRPIPVEVLLCPYCGRDYRQALQGTNASSAEASVAEPVTIREEGATSRLALIPVNLVLAGLLLISNAAWYTVANEHSSVDDSLKEDYDSLQERYNALENEMLVYETFALDSTVADYYETVRESNSMATLGWWSSLSVQDRVKFCADLARHDIGLFQWSSAETAYHDYYGTYSYNDAKARLTSFLGLSDVNSWDGAATKIEKILSSVVGFVEGRPDMNERYYAPWETLAYRTGDCDDFSTLTSALFQLAGIESAIEFASNDAGDDHAMVLVHLDSLGSFGYYSYANLTGYGLSSGRWIIIEPQHTIDLQDDSTWMDQWNIIAAAEV